MHIAGAAGLVAFVHFVFCSSMVLLLIQKIGAAIDKLGRKPRQKVVKPSLMFRAGKLTRKLIGAPK